MPDKTEPKPESGRTVMNGSGVWQYNDATGWFMARKIPASCKDIFFVYEAGTYPVNGSQISFTPKQANGGWWKKTNS